MENRKQVYMIIYSLWTAYNGTTILNSNDFQISMDKHFQVNYQLKAPLSPQPPYPHCVEKGGETHF